MFEGRQFQLALRRPFLGSSGDGQNTDSASDRVAGMRNPQRVLGGPKTPRLQEFAESCTCWRGSRVQKGRYETPLQQSHAIARDCGRFAPTAGSRSAFRRVVAAADSLGEVWAMLGWLAVDVILRTAGPWEWILNGHAGR